MMNFAKLILQNIDNPSAQSFIRRWLQNSWNVAINRENSSVILMNWDGSSKTYSYLTWQMTPWDVLTNDVWLIVKLGITNAICTESITHELENMILSHYCHSVTSEKIRKWDHLFLVKLQYKFEHLHQRQLANDGVIYYTNTMLDDSFDIMSHPIM